MVESCATPTIFNVGFDLFFTWDGKFETLSDLNDKVLQDAGADGNDLAGTSV